MKKGERDSIDEMLDRWGKELPDLDLVTEGIVERIQHLNFTLRKMREVWEESVGTQAAKEALVAEALDTREKDALNVLLRRLVRSTDDVLGPTGKQHDPA